MSTPLPPGADELDEPFWEAAARGELLVHRCDECLRCYWPATSCVDHGFAPMRWVPASGRGVVHTFTVFRKAFLPQFADRVPYVVTVVELDEGPFFHTGIVDCEPDGVHVGQRVEVVFCDTPEGWTLPYFRPAPHLEPPTSTA